MTMNLKPIPEEFKYVLECDEKLKIDELRGMLNFNYNHFNVIRLTYTYNGRGSEDLYYILNGETSPSGIRFPGKIPYFQPKECLYIKSKEEEIALIVICSIINKSLSYIIRNHKILPNFIKILFQHFRLVMLWADRFHITEVDDFLREIFELRRYRFVKKLSMLEFINTLGGLDFIQRILIADDPTNTKDEINSQIEDLHKKSKVEKVSPIEFIANDMRESHYVDHSGKRINVERIHMYVYAVMQFFYSYKKFNLPVISDINHIIEQKQMFSHFISTYNESRNNYYSIKPQSLINNTFYNEMKKNMEYIKSHELKQLMNINLHILIQNN